jgi:curved DNA-binding protein CbpA
MPKRDLYRVLGVSTQAAPGEIKRAYRRIAFAVHPDVGERPDPERFREVHDAYETLSDPDRRRSYDVEISIRRRPLSAEPLRRKIPVSIIDDFLTLRPSIDELFGPHWAELLWIPAKEWRIVPTARRRGDTGRGRSALRLPCAL